MSIYRGAGGAGDAVNDSSSEASLVAQLVIEAQADADAAQASATAAASSASTASTAATNASNSATAASTSATNASNSASSASTSATNAANSATAAQTAETNAETAETNAETAETNAETAASLAQEWATKLSTPVSGSDYSAKYNANLAATSATNASNSATAAAGSASTASAAADAALTALDNFDDRYLGQKSTAPTLDNDGNALLAGALYFNTVSNSMKVYTGSVWVDAYADGNTFLAKASNLSDLANAATARTNLGVAIGTNVQAYDADLTTLGAGGSSARSFLGLAIGTDVQAYDAQLADIAGLTPTDNSFIVGNGTNFVAEDASTARTSLGLGTIATQAAPAGTVVGTSDTQTLTNKTIALGSNTVSGTLAQFNTAVTDADFASIAGTETLTNKTLTSPVVTGGSINNTSIGATTASTGAFSTLSATGVTTVQAGSVSAPAITTTGDTNTGIFFPAADTIAFTEGGVESIRIDSSGNVGIGTATTTNSKFTVAASTSGTGGIRIESQFGSSYFGNYNNYPAMMYDGASLKPVIVYDTNNNVNILYTNNTEKMRINSSGQVGIGTSTPGTTLNVFTGSTLEGLRIQRFAGAYYSEFRQTDSPEGLAILVGDGATVTEKMRIVGSSGNVGIGTSSPASKLDVVGTASFSGTMGVGAFAAAPETGLNVRFIGNLTSTDITGVSVSISAPATASGSTNGVYSSLRTTATSGSRGVLSCFYAEQPSIGAGSSVSSANGLLARNQGNAAITNAYGVRIEPQSGATGVNYGLYNEGTSRFNGNIGLDTAPAASGTGITFPATQSASSDANTLDDYEEGTFTPGVTSGITSPVYANQIGFYTKVGRFVSFTMRVGFTSGTADSNRIILGSLPFVSNTSSTYLSGAFFVYVSASVINSVTTNLPTLFINNSSNVVEFWRTDGAGFSGTQLTSVGGADFYIVGSYFTN